MPAKRKAPAPPTIAAPAPKTARPSKLAKENDITAAQETEIREAFALFAVPRPASSKEGVIPSKDIRRALVALGVAPRSPAQLKEFLEILDPDDEGFAAYESFLAICALQMHHRPAGGGDGGHEEEVRHAFDLFLGRDGGGGSGEEEEEEEEEVLTIRHLRRIARELREEVDDDVLKDMILEANGGAGMAVGVGRAEFEALMKRAGVWR